MKKKLTKIIGIMLSALVIASVGLVPLGPVASAETAKDRPIKILAIGNSYSNNATQFISEIAKSMGLDITAASLYYQGCELKRHVKHYETYEELGKSDYYKADNKYKYEAFYVNGQSFLENLSIQEAVAYTDWDYITLQQMPNGCDDITTYWTEQNPYLTKLYDYVKAELKKNGNTKCEILLHQGWSFSHAMSIDRAYKYYPVDYDTTAEFFTAIESTVEEAADILKNHAGLKTAPLIIPSGKAVQLAKDKLGFGDNYGESNSMYADYISHMSNKGKYLVGCVWIETIAARAGLSVTDTRTATFIPIGTDINYDTAIALRSCAHEAVTGESDTTFGDWRAVPYGNGLRVVRYLGKAPTDGVITVPAQLDGKSVYFVDDAAFNGVEGFKSFVQEQVETPPTVTPDTNENTPSDTASSEEPREEEEGQQKQQGGANPPDNTLLFVIIGIVAALLVAGAATLIILKAKKII